MRITLCGSTKFKEVFIEANVTLTLKGHTVYSVSCYGHAEERVYTDKQKTVLDLVHLDKILNSDAIVVLNVDDYVGESLCKEVFWARMQGKDIYWLEPSTHQLPSEELTLLELLG